MKVGFDSQDITPFMGLGMPGSWDFHPVEEIHNHLKVRASIFDDGKTVVAVVGMDAIGVGARFTREVRESASKQTGIPKENILICGSHTHSGGPMGRAEFDFSKADALTRQIAGDPPGKEELLYQELTIVKAVTAITQAFNKRKEADICIGSGVEDKVSFNRRLTIKNGRVYTHPGKSNPDKIGYAGPIDPEVGVIGAFDKQGKLLGCLVNFTCHCTIMSGVSADYVHFIDKTVQSYFGEQAEVVFLQGASGDVTQVDNMSLNEAEFGAKYAEKVGVSVGAEVLKVLVSAEKGSAYPVAAVSTIVKIDRRKSNPQKLIEARKISEEKLKIKTNDTAYVFASERVMHDYVAKVYPKADVELQAIQIGDAVLISNPTEFFCQLGLDIKKVSKFYKTFIVELANGCISYVPDPKAFQADGGGYETAIVAGCLEVNAGKIMVDESINLISTLTSGTSARTPQILPEESGFATNKAWDYGVLGPDND